MGGLFILFIFSLLVIITLVILVSGIFNKKSNTGYSILLLWGTIFLLGLAVYIRKIINSKKVLKKEDFYGEYIIDRDYFSGKQSDWQYNNFRFEIKENDSIYFYVTDGQKTNKTYKGKISTLAPYKSARLVIKMDELSHHILNTNPTIYRETWAFFIVFNSPKFSNMYFRKGKWKSIN